MDGAKLFRAFRAHLRRHLTISVVVNPTGYEPETL